MSSEKTQMVDLLSSSKKKSWTIKNFSKDGFLIDSKLYNHSILISPENIHTWNILISEGRRAFACLKLK